MLLLIFTANVIIDLCHERDNYYQSLLHIYSNSELKDFLKALCTSSLLLHNCF